MDGPVARSSLPMLMAIIAGSVLLLLSRKPDLLLNAQFWAEDGAVWYRQAYQIGWPALLLPQNGYFQTISKLVALVSLSVDLSKAPLIFNLAALGFRVLPVLLLNMARGRALVPHAGARWLASFLYLAHPYSFEVFANVTNIHWHLALAALLVLCMDAWPGPWRKALDAGIVLLSGASGPFALFLAPVAAWRWYRERSERSLVLASIVVAMVMVQLGAILLTGNVARTSAPLGASWTGFLHIVGGQVAAAAILGEAWKALFATGAWQHGLLLSFGATALVAAVFVRALLAPQRVVSALALLGGAIFAAALLAPQISSTAAQWPLFARPGVGGRYAFLPIVAFHACLLWMAFADRHPALRWPARVLLGLVLVLAVPGSWQVRRYADLDFASHAARFEAAPPGTTVEIPINPEGWSFTLRKRAETE